jgi:hypothetical protein
MIILLLVYPLVLLWTLYVILHSWKKSANEHYRSDPRSVMLTVFGLLFTVVGPLIGFSRYDHYRELGIPFSPQHVFAVEFVAITGALSYWASRFYKREMPWLLRYLVLGGMLQGLLLCFVTSIHFAGFYGYGIAWAPLGFELFSPPVAFLFLLYELVCLLRPEQERSAAVMTPARWGLPLILVVAGQALLLPFGFSWNSLYLAFVQSENFIFSHS